MVRVAPTRTLAALLSLGLLTAACSSDDPPAPTGPTGNSSGMVAVAASVDLYTKDPQRVDLGLVMPDNSFVSFGTDPVATDSTAALVMGLDPAGIWHVSEAGRFLGQSDLEQVVQVGEDPERSMTSFDVLPVFQDLKCGSGGAHAGLGDANA